MPTAEQNEPAATQKFIITLDGVENKLKKPPSPIRYDKHSVSWKKTVNVPDHLPAVRPSPTIKNKERCKYWPSCRHGEKCEFVHPSTPCKMFPQCKFGDKCLYIHPSCKFESSCTRKDCPYSHTLVKKNVVGEVLKFIGPLKLVIFVVVQVRRRCASTFQIAQIHSVPFIIPSSASLESFVKPKAPVAFFIR